MPCGLVFIDMARLPNHIFMTIFLILGKMNASYTICIPYILHISICILSISYICGRMILRIFAHVCNDFALGNLNQRDNVNLITYFYFDSQNVHRL